MYQKNRRAFSLAELIVAIPLLPALLATIGFTSYSGYQASVRDTNRLAQIVSISDGLQLYQTRKDLPLPDNSVEIVTGSSLIAYQGYVGANTLETIDFVKGGKDPKDGNYFSYYLTRDRKYFQLMAFLEDEENTFSQNTNGLKFINSANAINYTNRIPTIYGRKLGVLTDIFNTPIQDISEIRADGLLDVSKSEDTSGYVAHISDTSKIKGKSTNSLLQYLESIAISGGVYTSCEDLLNRSSKLRNKNGVYIIDADGSNPSPTYCNMTVN